MNPSTNSDGTASSNFYVLVFGGVMLVGLLTLAWIGRPARPEIVGESLPKLDLQPLLNVEQAIGNEDLNGNLTVLHFWGTWCPPCQIEFPEFAELAAEFSAQEDVKIVSVSCSTGPEYDLEALKQKTIDFLADYEPRIPTYTDSAAMTRQQLALLMPNGSFGYPTTLLVDREGTIIASLEGYRPGEMEKLVDQIKSRL